MSRRKVVDNLTGVILCGGESRRMGRDKGMIPVGDTIWALHAAGKLQHLGIPVVFSVNQLQIEKYSGFIDRDSLVVDDLTFGINGPMKGLLSVHCLFPQRDLLLLACDMLDIDPMVIGELMEVYGKGLKDSERPDYFVFRAEGYFQPFCGIYTAGALAREYALAKQGDSTDHSMQGLLKRGRTEVLFTDRTEVFRNYNEM